MPLFLNHRQPAELDYMAMEPQNARLEHLRRSSPQISSDFYSLLFHSPGTPRCATRPAYSRHSSEVSSQETYHDPYSGEQDSLEGVDSQTKRLLSPLPGESESYFDNSGSKSSPYNNASKKLRKPYPRSKPIPLPQHNPSFLRIFERPRWWQLAIHLLFCLLAYPVLLGVSMMGKDRNIFWARIFVGMGCGLVGICLAFSLIELGRPYLEAATWATVIHSSHGGISGGTRLADLKAASSNPNSPWAAVRLLYTRIRNTGTARKARRTYDTRFWSLYIAFFIILMLVSGCMPFLLGRLVDIESTISHQPDRYYEVALKGDLSQADIDKAHEMRNSSFENFAFTWTISPFSSHGSLPPAVSFQWGDDLVYFSETTKSQLVQDGSGFGTYDDHAQQINSNMTNTAAELNSKSTEQSGSVLRYPKWGIRIHCSKLSDPSINLVPRTVENQTNVYVPQSDVNSLFESFGRQTPETFVQPVVEPNGPATSSVNLSTTSFVGKFDDVGGAHAFMSIPASMGKEGTGFTSIELTLVRINTKYAPEGKFPASAPAVTENGTVTSDHIGYDAAVCLEVFEPYVVEVYNSTFGLPSSTRIVAFGAEVKDINESVKSETNMGWSSWSGDPSIANRMLNSTKLEDPYVVAHQNAINQILKDNGRDSRYVTSPTVVSFSGGQGPYGYTELSSSALAQTRALSDATNLLPYLAGSGSLLARSYPDRFTANITINLPFFIAFLSAVLFLGITAALFVPKLPMSLPRRGFDIYTWWAAFDKKELVPVDKDQYIIGMDSRKASAWAMERSMGDVRFKYEF